MSTLIYFTWWVVCVEKGKVKRETSSPIRGLISRITLTSHDNICKATQHFPYISLCSLNSPSISNTTFFIWMDGATILMVVEKRICMKKCFMKMPVLHKDHKEMSVTITIWHNERRRRRALWWFMVCHDRALRLCWDSFREENIFECIKVTFYFGLVLHIFLSSLVHHVQCTLACTLRLISLCLFHFYTPFLHVMCVYQYN